MHDNSLIWPAGHGCGLPFVRFERPLSMDFFNREHAECLLFWIQNVRSWEVIYAQAL